MNNIDKLATHCENTLNLAHAKLSDEYYYNSFPFAVIDAIFSIGVRYTSTRATVIKYCDYFNLQRIRKQKSFSSESEQHTISELLENIKSVEDFSESILRNRQRTSAKSGILKAEAVLLWAKIFKNYGIETLQDFNSKCTLALELELKNVKGQSSGKSIAYLKMLCGNDNFCKPDRHILNFISECIGGAISPETAQNYLETACKKLQIDYPQLTVRLLDHSIWNYMSNK